MKYLYISSTYRWEDNENNSIYPCTNNSVGGAESEAKVSATEEETERRNPKKSIFISRKEIVSKLRYFHDRKVSIIFLRLEIFFLVLHD